MAERWQQCCIWPHEGTRRVDCWSKNIQFDLISVCKDEFLHVNELNRVFSGRLFKSITADSWWGHDSNLIIGMFWAAKRINWCREKHEQQRTHIRNTHIWNTHIWNQAPAEWASGEREEGEGGNWGGGGAAHSSRVHHLNILAVFVYLLLWIRLTEISDYRHISDAVFFSFSIFSKYLTRNSPLTQRLMNMRCGGRPPGAPDAIWFLK